MPINKENKKIINATKNSYKNIEFKSILEQRLYRTMVDAGFKPKYEKKKFVLQKGFRPTKPFYTEDRKHNLVLSKTKLQEITYTPDFTFEYNGILVIVEAKGFINDVYPVKRKLFRKMLERMRKPVLFFEIYSKRQMLAAIDIIKATANNKQ